jgi:general secretion pathway protein A
MYEAHFGLKEPPFQLNPDPAFYFDSRGHSNALAYLKFGVYQGEGFIVVTGDIGAGKTTLVRTMLAGLESEDIVAAQVVSTQLDPSELLQAVLTAFGVPAPQGASKAQLIASLEGFLTALAASNRRALLIVDEAQNLSLAAIEELRMLSNFQLERHALLQSFLIGQPELRRMLESPSMEQFRQRVIASCHLGPLDAGETRSYIEHRLKRAGWTDTPSFADGAFEEIHRWTAGVPRRINLLCNRLLLGAFLSNDNNVDEATVRAAANEIRGEVGESVNPVARVVSSNGAAAPAAQPRSAATALPPAAALLGAEDMVRRRVRGPLPELANPIVLLTQTPADYLKAVALSQGLEAKRQYALPPTLIVHTGAEEGVHSVEDVMEVLNFPILDLQFVATGRHGFADHAASTLCAFSHVIDEYAPRAVLAMGSSDALLACSLVARKRGLPLARFDAGSRQQIVGSEAGTELNSVLLDRIADVLYTDRLSVHYALYREGVPSDRIHFVGDLAGNVLRQLAEHLVPPEVTLRRAGMKDVTMPSAAGFLLLAPGVLAQQAGGDDTTSLMKVVCAAAAEVPVIWLVSAAEQAQIDGGGWARQLLDAQVVVLPALGYLERVGLLRAATCVITSDVELSEEAKVLSVPSIDLTQLRSAGRPVEQLQRWLREALMRHGERDDAVAWDAEVVNRVADHLRRWLRRSVAERNQATDKVR